MNDDLKDPNDLLTAELQQLGELLPKNYILNEAREVVAADFLTSMMWMLEHDEERQVAVSELPGEVLLSTVFMGVDHNWRRQGPPIVFETRVCGGVSDGWTERYTTWKDAAEGHARILAELVVQ